MHSHTNLHTHTQCDEAVRVLSHEVEVDDGVIEESSLFQTLQVIGQAPYGLITTLGAKGEVAGGGGGEGRDEK